MYTNGAKTVDVCQIAENTKGVVPSQSAAHTYMQVARVCCSLHCCNSVQERDAHPACQCHKHTEQPWRRRRSYGLHCTSEWRWQRERQGPKLVAPLVLSRGRDLAWRCSRGL